MKPDDNTSLGGLNEQFPATEWTEWGKLAIDEKALFRELYQRYWKPIYIVLRSKGNNDAKAKDLTQGFFTEKVLGQKFFEKADKSKGLFRSYLRTAVNNYAIDKQRQSKGEVPLDEMPENGSDLDDPQRNFDKEWANELLVEALNELKEECINYDKNTHWVVFHAWFLTQNTNKEKISMSNICSKYHISNVDQAYNMISNIKMRLSKILRRRLRRQVPSEADVDAEIGYFISLFSGLSPR